VKKSKKAGFLFLMSFLVFLLGGGAAFMLLSSNGEKSSEIARLKSEAKDANALEADLATLHTDVVTASEQLAHLEKGIPEIAYIPTMLKELETFGKANGIEVHGVRPVPAPKDKDSKNKRKAKPYNELTIEIKGRGNYRAVLNFIAALKTFPKIVAARTVSLQPKSGAKANETSVLDVTIELRAFLFKPDKEEVEQEDPESDITLKVTEENGNPVRPSDSNQGQTAQPPITPGAEGQPQGGNGQVPPNSNTAPTTNGVPPRSTAFRQGGRP
jgi:Tfp pilus assembly protein PilO